MAHDWAFLSTHGLVFLAVAQDPNATLRQIGDAVGLTERSAQKLVADLVDEGYLIRIREGRRNRYEINREGALRHPLSREHDVSALLGLLPDAETAGG